MSVCVIARQSKSVSIAVRLPRTPSLIAAVADADTATCDVQARVGGWDAVK